MFKRLTRPRRTREVPSAEGPPLVGGQVGQENLPARGALPPQPTDAGPAEAAPGSFAASAPTADHAAAAAAAVAEKVSGGAAPLPDRERGTREEGPQGDSASPKEPSDRLARPPAVIVTSPEPERVLAARAIPSGSYQFLVHSVHVSPRYSAASGDNPDRPPEVFVSVKTLEDLRSGMLAEASTTLAKPSRTPYFGEILILQVPASDGIREKGPEVVLSVVDRAGPSYLGQYILSLPPKQLLPFHQTTIALGPPLLPSSHRGNTGVHSSSQDQQAVLVVSVVSHDTALHLSHIPASQAVGLRPDDVVHMVHPEITNAYFEVELKRVRHSDAAAPDERRPCMPKALLAVIRAVPDIDAYSRRMEKWRNRVEEGIPSDAPSFLPAPCYVAVEPLGGSACLPALNRERSGSLVHICALGIQRESEDGSRLLPKPSPAIEWDEYCVPAVDMATFGPASALVAEFHFPPSPYSVAPFSRSAVSVIGNFWGFASINFADARFLTSAPDSFALFSGVPVTLAAPNVLRILAGGTSPASVPGGEFVCDMSARPPRNWRTLVEVSLRRSAQDIAKAPQGVTKANGQETEPGFGHTGHEGAQQSQRLIDRLLAELDARTEMAKKLGSEIVKMRDATAELQLENQELQRQLRDRNLQAQQLIHLADIDLLSPEELRRRYAILAGRLDSETAKCRDLTLRVEDLQHTVSMQGELKGRLADVQAAHTAQQALVQKLQERLKAAAKYRTTIKKQELVIQKYEEFFKGALTAQQKEACEALVANVRADPAKDVRHEDHQRAQNVAPPHSERARSPPRNRTEEPRARSADRGSSSGQIKASLQRREETILPVGYLNHRTHASDPLDEVAPPILATDDVEILKLLLRAEKAEARAAALEKELIGSAKTYGRQIADLSMQLEERGGQARPVPQPEPPLWRTTQPPLYNLQKLGPGGCSSSRTSSPAGATRIKPSGYLDPIVMS